MDIQVVFTDGSQRTVQIHPESSIEDVVPETTGLQSGQLSDYSLAWQNKHSDSLVNIDWLLPGIPLAEQGVEQGSALVLCKKFFAPSSTDLQHLEEPLLGWLYHQLLHTFVKGLYRCSTFQAAQIAAIACQVERLSPSSLQQPNGEGLQKVLPKRFSTIKGMDRLVIKALRREVGGVSRETAQRAFVQRLQRQDTFGLAFYSATFEENGTRFPVLIGIGPENISKLDIDQMEVLDQWEMAELVKCTFNIGTFTMKFGQEVVTMETNCGHMIHDYITGMQKLTKQQTRMVAQKPPQQKMPSPKPPPKPAKLKPKPGSPGTTKKPVPPPKPTKKLSLPPATPAKPNSSTTTSTSSSSPLLKPRKKSLPQEISPGLIMNSVSTAFLQESEELVTPVGSPVGSGGKLSTDSSGDERGSPSLISRSRGGRNMAIKRRKTSCFAEEEFVPQDYEALYSVVNDTVDEVSRLLGDENWVAHMDCSQQENPIYDQIVASDTETLLRSSSVTYRALSETFKRSIKKKEKKQKKKKKTSISTPPVSPKPSRPLTSPKPERARSVLLSDKSKKGGITKLAVTTDGTTAHDEPIYNSTQGADLEYDYVVIQRGAVKRPMKPPDKPQLTRKESVEPPSGITPVQASKPPLLPKPTIFDTVKPQEDDVFYDDVRVLKKKPPLTAKISLPNISLGGQTSAHLQLKKTRYHSETGRPGVDLSRTQQTGARLLKNKQRSSSAISEEKPSPQETSLAPPPKPPQETSLAPPPKPPRLKHRQSLQQLKEQPSSSSSGGGSSSEGVGGQPTEEAVRGGVEETDSSRQQKSRMLKPGEILQDYVTLQREFRVFFIKLPSGAVHSELANLSVAVGKLVARLCVLLCLEDPSQYLLFVEGAALTSVREKETSSDDDQISIERSSALSKRQSRRTPSPFEHFSQKSSFTILPDQGTAPILLNPELSFEEQAITSTRVLALRPKPGHAERVPRIPLRVPDWVRFHQCWLAVVQGNQPCSLQDAIKLAALQYQMYFKDRTEINSIIGFCKSSDFLPLEYSRLSGLEEKIFSEQQTLKGLSRQEAQEAYISACTALPTYGTIFFPCKELKKRVFQGNKLTTVVLGINKEGIMRVDAKTKEVLDMWPYPALKNWGSAKSIFLLDFSDRSYPIKTNQAKWMNDLVSFHVDTIMKSKQSPPATTTVALSGRDKAEIVLRHYEMDPRIGVEEVYYELFASSESSSRYDRLTAEEIQRNYHVLANNNNPSAPLLNNNRTERYGENNYHVLEQLTETSEERGAEGSDEQIRSNDERKCHHYHTLDEWSGKEAAGTHHYDVLEQQQQQQPVNQATCNGYDSLHKPVRSRGPEVGSNGYSVLEQTTKGPHHYHTLEPPSPPPQVTLTHNYTTPHSTKMNHGYHVLEKQSSQPNSRTSSPSGSTQNCTAAPQTIASLVPLPTLFSQPPTGPYRVTRLASSMEGSDPSHKYQPLAVYAVPGEQRTAYDVPQTQQQQQHVLEPGEAIYDEPEALLSN